MVEAAGFDSMNRCDPQNSRNTSFCREGTSLLELINNPDEWKTAVFYQQPRGYYQGYTVLTEQYRFSQYVNLLNPDTEGQRPDWGNPEDFGELYDLKNDPMENINLIHNENYEDVIHDLKQILHQGWAEQN